MAGGNWSAQNKIRPGVYINFDSATQLGLTVGMRGVVAICEPMSWGAVGEVVEVKSGVDTTAYCGYPIYEKQALFLRAATEHPRQQRYCFTDRKLRDQKKQQQP